MIRLKVSQQRQGFQLLLDTTLLSGDAQCCAIYGHSGAGKTSLLRWIAGLESDAEGELYFKQQCWQAANGACWPSHRRQIGYVFQDARLFPHLSVAGNLDFAFQRRCNDRGPSVEQVCDWLQLQSMLEQSATTLSGGQQQRVAIARALLYSPQLILMDEPLGALDWASKQQILPLLQRLKKNIDTPMLYVSHSIEEVSQLADELLLLEQGNLLAQGELLELSTRLDLPLSHEENAAAIVDAHVRCHDDRYGLSELQPDNSDDAAMFVTRGDWQAGDALRLRVPARDVSISLQKACDSSILNILPCTVDAIEQSSAARLLVRLRLGHRPDSGQPLLARLTHKSVAHLGLEIGQRVFAQIKTVALLSDKG